MIIVVLVPLQLILFIVFRLLEPEELYEGYFLVFKEGNCLY